MLENRRYTRYDVSNEKISIQIYDVTGFVHVGYLTDISAGGLKFKTKSPVKWNKNTPLTVYFQLPNEDSLISMDIRPVRSNHKFFYSQHAGEFIGTFVLSKIIKPVLTASEKAKFATV